MTDSIATKRLDVEELRSRVEAMYHRVAVHPEGEFHFEMGSGLARRLGYPASELDAVPAEAVRSFAGVGYYFDLANVRAGERVADLGSGSGMDSFLAARRARSAGRVIGVDMTEAQLEKASRLAGEGGFEKVSFRRGYLEELPLDDASVDVVISNGVINLVPDKGRVFREIARVLRPGGRMAIADIVTTRPLPENVTCDATLWAACIGGAAPRESYLEMAAGAGLRVLEVRENPAYRFLSRSARGASRDYGVRSVSVLAGR